MYQVEVTINLPNGEEVDWTFINTPFDTIVSVIETDYPNLTSFTMACARMKKEEE